MSADPSRCPQSLRGFKEGGLRNKFNNNYRYVKIYAVFLSRF